MKKENTDPQKHKSSIQESGQIEKMNFSGDQGSRAISRRSFITGTLSVVIATSYAYSNAKPDSNESENNYDKPELKDITIIDTHTHFYDPARPIPEGRDRPVPWPSPKDKILYKKILPPDWETHAKPLGMRGTVVVEGGTPWLEDNDWILSLAERHKSIVGFIGNLSGTAIESGKPVPVWDDINRFGQEVRRLERNRFFRGIRVGGRSISNDLTNRRYPHFELLANAGLVTDVLNVPAEDIISLAKALPALIIIVDHMYGFKTELSSSEKWRGDIKAMGEHQNIVMKVSGFVEGCDSPQTDPDTALIQCRGALDHVFRMFGPDRLVFGTNWPVSQPKGEMSVVKGIVHNYFSPKGNEVLSKVFAGNAKRVYKYLNR
jgi:L-fuconolactonase